MFFLPFFLLFPFLTLRRNAERFLGQIAEVIIYSTNISLADFTLVENYLSNKYGITVP